MSGDVTSHRIRHHARGPFAAATLATLVILSGLGSRGGLLVRAASGVAFGTPTITSTFQVGIDMSEPVTLPAGVQRIEALVHSGSDTRLFVDDVTVPGGAGPTQLSYHLATPAGDTLPNTPVQIHFRVTLVDGTTEEGPVASVLYQDTRFAWKTLVGTVVRVHWVEGDDAFGRKALAIGDKAIADTSKLLGVTETEPVDFFIYPDTQSFYDVLGPAARENVGGVAFPDIRTLLANIGPDAVNDPWVGIVIPHELTHLVFGTATQNPYHTPPHWFNEGLAVYLSQGYDTSDRSSVADATRARSIMPLTALDGQFPTTPDRFSLAYAESVSAIDYLIRTYGQDALVKVIRSWGTGASDDEAFEGALGVDVAGFESGWLAALGIPRPSPLGPQPAPAGPVPPGWTGGAAGSGGGAIASPAAAAAASPAPVAGSGEAVGPSGSDLAVEAIIVVLAAFGVIGLAAVVMRRRRADREAIALPFADDPAPRPASAPSEPPATGGLPPNPHEPMRPQEPPEPPEADPDRSWSRPE